MRVLMATMQLDIGGAETHIVELSKALARRGIEVFVASNGGAYVKELEDAGIPHFKVALNRKTPASMYSAYKALKKIIFENKIDVVHAHARIPGFLCGLLAKRYNLRFVTTAHWVFDTRFPLNLLTNWGSRSLAVSDDIKQYLIDNYGCNADNIRVTINGVDTAKFSDSIDYSDIAQEFDFQKDATRIVYVSRMDTDRSFAAHKLIEAMPVLCDNIKNLETVIVGGGNDFEKINAEAEEMNRILKRRAIIVTGGRTDINKFAASGDVFVGVSRAALEAMACKKPAIIAGNEGYIGIFDESKLAVSIDTNFCCRGCGDTTTEKLTADLLALLGDDKVQYRKALGEYSLETVKKYYSVETMASDALKMYISEIKDSKINKVDDAAELADIEKYLIHGNSPRDIDIMVSGYYGFHNSGDDSILDAMIKDLRAAVPNANIIVMSKSPRETANEYNVSTVDRFDFVAIWNLLKKTRLLISGGGSLIQDVTSSLSLYYYLSIISMARSRGAKVMLYANGIGPLTKKYNLPFVKNTLKKVDCVTLRDKDSKTELLKLLPQLTSAQVTADPVFTAEAEQDEAVDKALGRAGIDGDKKFFVVSVRDWEDMDPDVDEKIAQFGDYVYEKHGIMPFIIPLQSRFDKDISEEIEVLTTVPHGLSRNGYAPELLMGIIGRAEFVVGMRLHSLIYAAKMGIPSIALDYDPKVEAAMKSIGLDYSLKVGNIDKDKLCQFADEIVENRESLCKALRKKSQALRELAKSNTEAPVELLKK